MRKITAVFVFFLCLKTFAQQKDSRMSREDYIEKFKIEAVKDMLKTGVPASITLAQALLESENGNSPLAVNANNHFGIKCHDWKGERYYHDDDKRHECFRKYDSVLESYDDHSEFLRTRERYAFLFTLSRTDYKGWAQGLKKAGYATAPDYAERLIKIIEDAKLYSLDKIDRASSIGYTASAEKSIKSIPQAVETQIKTGYTNDVKCVFAHKGDSFKSIAEAAGISMSRLMKYNETDREPALRDGDRVYLQPKRRKCRKERYHTAGSGDTIYAISQQYGVRMKFILKRNGLNPGDKLYYGQKIRL